MARNLKDFFNALQTNGVRLTNQYQITFTIPAGGILPDNISDDISDITMWAEGVQAPGFQQGTAELKYKGFSFTLPNTGSLTTDLSLTLRLKNQMQTYIALLQWLYTITDLRFELVDNNGGGDKSLHSMNARIDMYDTRLENIIMTYKLVGIYPVNIGEIDLSNNDPQLATCKCDFKYQYWIIDNITAEEPIKPNVTPVRPADSSVPVPLGQTTGEVEVLQDPQVVQKAEVDKANIKKQAQTIKNNIIIVRREKRQFYNTDGTPSHIEEVTILRDTDDGFTFRATQDELSQYGHGPSF